MSEKMDGRIRCRLRPSGGAFLIIAALVQLAAWNTGNNLLYVIAGAIISFLVLSYFLTRLTLRGIRVVREAPASVHRLDSFGTTLHIRNARRLFPAISLRAEHDSADSTRYTHLDNVPAQATATFRISHVIEKRGVHALAPVSVSTAFPMGLFLGRLAAHDGKEIVVYPRVHTLRMGVLEQMHGAGQTPRLRRGDADEFFGLRDYIPGDDMRHIAWRVSARIRRLVVRELEPNTSKNVHIIFDARGVPRLEDFEERFEEAVELVASLAVTLLNQLYEVSVITPDVSVPLNHGNVQAIKILDMLARISPAFYNDHGDQWFHSKSQPGSGVYVFVSPDPGKWGRSSGFHSAKVLNPQEVVRA